jgi:agmatine/peptidylarginine deiminase
MIQAEYQPVSKILLAYPERFYNSYDELVPFYDELISLVPNDFQIWIITNNNQTIRRLEEKYAHKKIDFLGLKGWDEIWLRDCIGIIKCDEIIKPKYYPNYCCSGTNDQYYKKINGLSRTIIKECLKKDILEMNLYLDGGNFVCNDQFVYMTDKVLEQNSIYSKREIDSIIKDLTGLIPITIEKNKCDVIGHTDAYLSFIDSNTAAIANYPSFPFLKDDIDFIKHLDEELRSVGIKRINLYDRPIDEVAICGCGNRNNKPCFYSARGNYLNFIRLNKTIILPEYNLSSKKETDYYNKTNQDILEGLGFEVLRINCDKLAKFGGVLHCISFTA